MMGDGGSVGCRRVKGGMKKKGEGSGVGRREEALGKFVGEREKSL